MRHTQSKGKIRHELKLDANDIRALLNHAVRRRSDSQIRIIKSIQDKNLTIPNSARVQFGVPTGGDYSEASCDIDNEFPIRVVWEEDEDCTFPK